MLEDGDADAGLARAAVDAAGDAEDAKDVPAVERVRERVRASMCVCVRICACA